MHEGNGNVTGESNRKSRRRLTGMTLPFGDYTNGYQTSMLS
jgi:hypothetical protein